MIEDEEQQFDSSEQMRDANQSSSSISCIPRAGDDDYLHQGNWRYVILALFWILLLAGTAIACKNWQDDPEQRTGRHLGIWLIRMLIGCMSGRITLKRAGSIFHNLVGA